MPKKYELSKLEYYIYERLIDGKTQTYIKKLVYKQIYNQSWNDFQLKKDINEPDKKRIDSKLSSMVSYYAKKLLKRGLIRERKYHFRGKVVSGNPKTYMATALTPIVSETTTSKVSETESWEQKTGLKIEESDIYVHHISYKFKVYQKPKRKMKWDHGPVKLRSGVEESFLYWPSKKDPDHVTIRYMKCQNKDDEVVIWFPSTVIPAGQSANKVGIIDDHVFRHVARLQRILQCRLGLPEVYREPHFETPLREPEIIGLVEKGHTFSMNGVDMNDSPPKGSPGFESSFEKVKCYSEMPDRVLRIEKHLDGEYDRLKRIEMILEKAIISLSKVIETQEKISESHALLIEHQETFQKNVAELVGLRGEKDKERKKENINMFG